jgi:hypothetical protein
MDRTVVSRPWRHLHGVTWLVGLVVAIALVAVNVQGNYEWIYGWGWPVSFAMYDPPPDEDVLSRPPLPFRPGYATSFFPLRLAANVALLGLIMTGSLWTIERWCRAIRISLRFGMKWPLAILTWIACFISLNRPYPWWYTISQAAYAVAYVALALACLAMFDAADLAWTHIAGGRSPGATDEVGDRSESAGMKQ